MASKVKIGDKFRRPGKFLVVYRVVALRAYDSHLCLAELVQDGQHRDVLTIPVATLLNFGQWRPVVGED
ncbi:MAG: hypothetical protein WCK65_07230 [Rhodospirillaceae bacterium]